MLYSYSLQNSPKDATAVTSLSAKAGRMAHGVEKVWLLFHLISSLTHGVEKVWLLSWMILSGSWADYWEGFGRVWWGSSYTCPGHGWWCQWCHQKSSGGTCKETFRLTEAKRTSWYATLPGCCPCYAQFTKYLGSVSCSRYTYSLLATHFDALDTR